jgi:diguanylate cyclase (GGDEF)-like protein/PAS domain S-box-containing protein
VIQVIGLDGIARARRHGSKVSFGEDMRDSQIVKLAHAEQSGNFVTRGQTDGDTRLQTYRRLREYPLIVGVGVASREALASVNARAAYYYGWAALGSVIALLVAAGLLFGMREQQRAARALRDSEERFRQMAGGIRDVFFLQDLDISRMYYVSPAYEQVWGRSCESLYAHPQSFAEAIHPHDRPHVLASAARGRDTGFDHEFRIIRPDGALRWIQARGFPIRDARGVAYRMAGVATDITERKLAEEQREKVQAQYRATFDQAAVGVTHTSLDGRFVIANRKLCEMLGYSEAELQALRFGDITQADDVSPSRRLMQELLTDPTQAFLPPIDKRYVRKDGSVLWATVAAAIVRDAGGAPQYFVTTILDITSQKAAQAALIESEAQFQQLARNIPEGFWITDVRTRRLLFISPVFEAIAGRRPSSAEAAWGEWTALIHPQDRERAIQVYRQMDVAPQDCDYRIVRPDGALRWVRSRGYPVRDAGGVIYRIAGTVEDITERKSVEETARRAEAHYRATFDQAAVGIAHASLDGALIKVNHHFCSLLGYEESELVGRRVADITHPADRKITEDMGWRLAREPEAGVPEYEKRYLRKDGSALWVAVAVSLVRDSAGAPDYFIAMIKDISARKDAEQKLVHQAHYDALTQLPNRTVFYDRLAQTLEQCRRHEWNAALLYLDIDRFKVVNDTLGHPIGDALLQKIAARLAACLRGGDTVARIGGDEFGVIAADLRDAQDAGKVAQKIVEALQAPFDLDGHELFVSASIGIAVFPLDGADGNALTKNADAAMFSAKERGRNNYQFYTAEMNEKAMERLLMQNDLRRALERREFSLHFQPKASLADGRIAGFEALLRWKRPGQRAVSPAEFVPILEDTGLIVPVGTWVIRAACRQLADWRAQGVSPVPVAVNVSAKQFVHCDLCAVVDDALREFDVPPSLLEVEITETDAMESPAHTEAVLKCLKARGVRIAIDDFGTGYSSLGYLKRFMPDTLKLDRSFVSGLPEDDDDISIACAVVTMAHSLGLKVVAEGVETAAQRDFLAAQGCDEMQGYLLSRPKPAAECCELLRPALDARQLLACAT